MPRYIARCGRISCLVRNTITTKFLIIILSFSFLSILWTQVDRDFTYNELLVQEALENGSKDSRYAEVYRKVNRLPKDLKYILLWTPKDYAPFYFFGSGQKAFIRNNCSVINCYVTAERKFLGGDVTKFDAVAFNGRNLLNRKRAYFPRFRSPHQKYIYFNTESADNYPVCTDTFDDLFNWTATYKLDSDIPYPYIVIRNSEGEIVGPRRDMEWAKEVIFKVDEELPSRLQNKSLAAAWFVSHCTSISDREGYVQKLQKAMKPLGIKIDIYGKCGPLKCPKDQQTQCSKMLERDYFFYMSMENSFAEDYVTEKLLTALQHDAVPIVFGGANYSRFLPPNSYLDARAQSPEELAATIWHLMRSPLEYRQFFKWKGYYTYHDAMAMENVCSVCSALNNKEMVETSTVYKDFRSWWNPDYVKRCKKKNL